MITWKKVKLELVEDWKKAHKFLTVWLAALVFALAESAQYLPEIKEYLPENWMRGIAATIFIARMLRLRKPDAAKP